MIPDLLFTPLSDTATSLLYGSPLGPPETFLRVGSSVNLRVESFVLIARLKLLTQRHFQGGRVGGGGEGGGGGGGAEENPRVTYRRLERGGNGTPGNKISKTVVTR